MVLEEPPHLDYVIVLNQYVDAYRWCQANIGPKWSRYTTYGKWDYFTLDHRKYQFRFFDSKTATRVALMFG
jgi:hypothetical protein